MIKTTFHNPQDFAFLATKISPHHVGFTRTGEFTAISPDQKHFAKFSMRTAIEAAVRRLANGEDMSFGTPNFYGNYTYTDGQAQVKVKAPDPGKCKMAFTIANKADALKSLVMLGVDPKAAKEALGNVSISAMRKRTDTSDPETFNTESYSIEIVKNVFKMTFSAAQRPDDAPYDPQIMLNWESETYELTVTYREAFVAWWHYVKAVLDEAGIPLLEGSMEVV